MRARFGFAFGMRTRQSRLTLQLARLQDGGTSLTPDERARRFNRAGDLAAMAGALPEAMACYGKAVDAYLEAGYLQAAGSLCRKLVKLQPGVARARCTLASLALGRRLFSDAEREIVAYTAAAARSGTHDLAALRLRHLADLTDDTHLRGVIARCLGHLGDRGGAAEVMALRPGCPLGDESDLQGDRWSALLRVVTLSPDELRAEQRAGLRAGLRAEQRTEPLSGSARQGTRVAGRFPDYLLSSGARESVV